MLDDLLLVGALGNLVQLLLLLLVDGVLLLLDPATLGSLLLQLLNLRLLLVVVTLVVAPTLARVAIVLLGVPSTLAHLVRLKLLAAVVGA